MCVSNWVTRFRLNFIKCRSKGRRKKCEQIGRERKKSVNHFTMKVNFMRQDDDAVSKQQQQQQQRQKSINLYWVHDTHIPIYREEKNIQTPAQLHTNWCSCSHHCQRFSLYPTSDYPSHWYSALFLPRNILHAANFNFSHFLLLLLLFVLKSWAILMQSYILLSSQCRSRCSYNWLSALKFCVRVIRTWLSIVFHFFNASRPYYSQLLFYICLSLPSSFA